MGTSPQLIHRAVVQTPSALSSLCAAADTQLFYFSLSFLVSLSPKRLLPFTTNTQNFTGRESAPGSLSMRCWRKQIFAVAC